MNTTIRFDDYEDILDIRFDNVFKAVFTKDTEASQTALSGFVSAVVGRNLSVLSIVANEPPIENTRDRQVRFDINCRSEDGELIDVEMGLDPRDFEPVRLEYYTAKLFIGQDIKGSEKSYGDLKRTYQIAILVKANFFPDGDFFHCFEYYDPARRITLGGRTRIFTLELSKLEDIATKPVREMSAQEKWAVFFQYLPDPGMRKVVNEIMTHEEGIAMASQVLQTISRDDEERAYLLSREKYELDMQSIRVNAERRGELRGELRGEIKGERRVLELMEKGYTAEEIKRELARK